MKNFLLYLWQFPQNLLGLLVILFTKAKKDNFLCIYKTSHKIGVSLGDYIILDKNCSWDDVKHETGHQRQSQRLGWLYLLVIGLPSIVCNIYDRIAHKKWIPEARNKWYFNLPWEKQADLLGDVKR